ncbi:MAG: hypothetical protein JW850_22305 [Thermoflexales bacterium]|nr:hypothetical protein [Thermoflexales bacterium]
MHAFTQRFNYLFRSTKGLVLVAIALISLVTALWGTLSGPMAELGIRDVVVRLLGFRLVDAEREGRIIMLYHTIAMAVVAIEVYIINDLVPVRKQEQATVNALITVGYITAMFGGLIFGYFGRNWVFHGLFIFGQSLVFFSGILFAKALWPWRKEFYVKDKAYAHAPGGLDLERVAFFSMAIATLISVLFGAVAGSFFGNGFESFLAEDVVRQPHKEALQLAIIGHLHIMLALIAVAAALIVGRWLDFKGTLHKWSMPLMIVGSLVLSMGTWLVVPFEAIAHVIIYVGSGVVMLGALLLVIFGWRKLIQERLATQGIQKATFFQGLAALLHDPLKFGALWQMVFMNFTVSGVGIFMAVKLDEIIRVWPARDERITLTGHWHILAAITATIILFYYADMAGLKGKARQCFGWLLILASDLAFGAVTVFGLKRLWVSEAAQQPLVDTTILLGDIGLATVLVVLAALMVWRLLDLFKRKGHWADELGEEVQP